jgi:hypothetical protein
MSRTRNLRRNGSSSRLLFIAVITATLLLLQLPTAAAWGPLATRSSRRTHAFASTHLYSSSSTSSAAAAEEPKPKVAATASASKKKAANAAAAAALTSEYCAERIRNFSIIAHIDHGKVRFDVLRCVYVVLWMKRFGLPATAKCTHLFSILFLRSCSRSLAPPPLYCSWYLVSDSTQLNTPQLNNILYYTEYIGGSFTGTDQYCGSKRHGKSVIGQYGFGT